MERNLRVYIERKREDILRGKEIIDTDRPDSLGEFPKEGLQMAFVFVPQDFAENKKPSVEI